MIQGIASAKAVGAELCLARPGYPGDHAAALASSASGSKLKLFFN